MYVRALLSCCPLRSALTQVNCCAQVYLAMEERDPQAVPVAESLISIFRTNFQDIQYTLHPSDIPGEAAGKSSNISWCARHAVLKHRDTILRNDVLMTTMDSKSLMISLLRLSRLTFL